MEFNNQILEAICKECGVTKTNVMAYHPASNGMVERHNRKIIQNIRTMVGDVSTSWHEWMPQVMASLNSSLHKTIGETPHFVVFGKDLRVPSSVFLTREDPVYNFDDYVRLRSVDFQRIYRRVRDNIAHNKADMNEQQWKSPKEKLVVIGDIVYLKVHEPKDKLAARFEGPYQVIDYETGNKVEMSLHSRDTKVAHLDHLKTAARPNSTVMETDDDLVPNTRNRDNGRIYPQQACQWEWTCLLKSKTLNIMKLWTQ